MTFSLKILPEVEEDTFNAFAWYKAKSPGLGEEFLNIYYDTLLKLPQCFLNCSRIHGVFWRNLLKRFPYAIYFTVANSQINVVGLLHCARNPLEELPQNELEALSSLAKLIGKPIPLISWRGSLYTGYFGFLQEAGHITTIGLADQKLSHFPEEIFTFKHLQKLDLSFNRIQTIPDNIECLKDLQVLILRKNRITPKSREPRAVSRIGCRIQPTPGIPSYNMELEETAVIKGKKK